VTKILKDHCFSRFLIYDNPQDNKTFSQTLTVQ